MVYIALIISFLFSEYSLGEYRVGVFEVKVLTESTDLDKFIRNQDDNFTKVEDEHLLTSLINSEIKVGCPEIIFITFDSHGHLLKAVTFTRIEFTLHVKTAGLKKRQAYIVLTLFKTYFIDRRNRDNLTSTLLQFG